MGEYLNIGCGGRYASGDKWTNIDIRPVNHSILPFDIRKGLPFGDGAFELVYHSHLLEHLDRSSAPGFMKECFRVLKPGGILRVVVPDLEQICRLYLLALDKVKRGDAEGEGKYEWMTLELMDQLVREYSGGGMLEYSFEKNPQDRDFVISRIGGEAVRMMEEVSPPRRNNINRKPGSNPKNWISTFKRAIFRKVAGESNETALRIGRFRMGGEPHLWMYDSYSLAKLMQTAGFADANRMTAFESALPEWSRFHLDTTPEGDIYKPDSLFMEAFRPA